MSAQDRTGKLKASFGSFMSNLFDLMLLNFLWILCSLPVLTTGPATGALFSVGLRLAKGEQVHTVQAFFKAFRDNFRQTLYLGLIGLFAAVVIFSDGVYAFSVEGALKTAFGLLTGLLVAALLTYFSYVFALQARYENTNKKHIQNAFLLAFGFPGQTVLMWVIYILPAALFLLLPQYVVAYIGVLYLMMGISLPVYLGCRVLTKVLARFGNGESNDDEESDKEDGKDEH